jgi:ABC-type transport system involved in multi-copper enzyme maturation permease subunit
MASIAMNTFREAIRSKVLGALSFFVVLSSVAAALLGELSLHEEVRVTTGGTLFASTQFTVIIAVYSMVTLLHIEIEKRTVYTILTKPIARWQFLVGKYLGVGVLVAVVTFVLYLVAVGLIVAQGGQASAVLAMAFVTIFMQALIIAGVTLALASFSSPLLSGLIACSLYISGNLVSQLRAARGALSEKSPLLGYLADVVAILLPNFESLNLSSLVVHNHVAPSAYLLSAAWYTLAYVCAAIVVAIVLFERRDLG